MGGGGEGGYVGYAAYGFVFGIETGVAEELGHTDDDAAGGKIVVEGFAFAQELGGEKQIETRYTAKGIFGIQTATVAYGYGGLYHHYGAGVDAEDEVDDVFNVMGVEVVFDRVVVGGRGNDYEVGIGIGCGSVECGNEVEGLFGQVFFDVLVLYGRLFLIDEVDLFGNNVDGRYLMMLC